MSNITWENFKVKSFGKEVILPNKGALVGHHIDYQHTHIFA